MDVAKEIEKCFLPLCQSIVDRLSKIYPQYDFTTWSSSTGSLTEYQGYDVGVECVFPQAKDNQANCVAITIGVKHLKSIPVICEASVGWGAGCDPDVGMEVIDEPIHATKEAIDNLKMHFGKLTECFEQAVGSWAKWAESESE